MQNVHLLQQPRRTSPFFFIIIIFVLLGMRNSTGSPIFSDFKSDLSRVARFLTAGQGERRLWVRGCVCSSLGWLVDSVDFQACAVRSDLNVAEYHYGAGRN